MPTTSEYLGGTSAGLDLLTGLFGLIGGDASQDIFKSRGRMLRMEAEEDARRYAEQAETFRQQQAVAYTKSGVQLTGSPLAVLDETARIAAENVSAIRARGRAQESEMRAQGRQAAAGGRAALVGGLTSAAQRLTRLYGGQLAREDAAQPRNNGENP